MAAIDSQWHLNKKVPVTIIVVLAFQLVALVWQAATVNAQVAALQLKVERMEDMNARLVRVETKLDNLIYLVNKDEARNNR
jgi:hypothetical protein